MKLTILLIFITHSVIAQKNYDFAIYHDGDIGAWEDGVIAFERFLDWKKITYNRVTALDINTTNLKDFYKAIYFPGGDADYYNKDINSRGIKHIQDLVSNNGAYIGICAGAEYACDKLYWQGDMYDYPLNLFQGEAIGPIDEIAVWPDFAMSTFKMNPNDEINQFNSINKQILYWGGCVFNPYKGTSIDTVATFSNYLNKPAIIKLNFGTGRVLLISPHPEIEEDDYRDGTHIAETLSDNGSDWDFLWTATDWLLGKPLSKPNTTLIQNNKYSSKIGIYSNPINNVFYISMQNNQKIESLTIYNQTGQIILELNEVYNSIDVSELLSGIYFIEIETISETIIKKIVRL